MSPAIVIALRLLAACIFSAGAVWLAMEGKDGWGWCMVCAIVLGCVTYDDQVANGAPK